MSLRSDHTVTGASRMRAANRKRRMETVSGAAEIQWACERLVRARRLRLYVQKLIETMSEAPAPQRRARYTPRRPR